MSAEEFNITATKSMKSVLAVRKLIPIYQRNFVWNSDLRKEFFSDLVDAAARGIDAPEYFIGSMVFRKNESHQFEVVDGQQRITTILLLVSCAAKLGEQRDSEGIYRRTWMQAQMDLHTDRPEVDAYGTSSENNLQHADPFISRAYETIARGELLPENSDVPMIKKLRAAQSDTFDFLKVFIHDLSEKDQAKALARFLTYITNKVVCIHHVAVEMDTALTIFGRLNASGKPLNRLEILKGMSFQAAQQDCQWQQIEQEWKQLEKILHDEIKLGGKGRSKALIGHDSMLSYKLFLDLPQVGQAFSQTDDAWVGGEKLARLLLDPIMRDVMRDPVAFIDSMTQFAREIRILRTADSNSIELPEIHALLQDIAHTSPSQTQWLMLAIPLLRNFGREVEAFRALRNMVFVFSHVQTGSGKSSAIYKRLASKLANAHLGRPPNSKDLHHVVQLMREEVENLLPEYEAQLRSRRYVESADQEKIKWALQLIEVELHSMYGVGNYRSLLDFAYSKKLNVDHLQPTNLGLLSEDDQQQIGNLSYLTESSNKGLQDLKFESEEKQAQLMSSNIWCSKALSQAKLTGKERKALSTFTSRQTMTTKDVQDRADELLAFIRTRLTC